LLAALFCFQNNSEICTPPSEVLGDNSAVPHHEQPGVPKELLNQVNNQLEMIVRAAEVSRNSSDLSTKNCCEQIQSAVFRASKLLKAHFQETVSSQPASHEGGEAVSPVLLDRPDQGSLAGKSPANTLL
jgi:hypothetical protein